VSLENYINGHICQDCHESSSRPSKIRKLKMTDEVTAKVLTEEELLKIGLEKLDEALNYFDAMEESFKGRNLASLVYVAIHYGESLSE